MVTKPTTASAYSTSAANLVRSACLYLATKFSDLREDLVIVGGLVPSLLIPQAELPANMPLHVGTMDLDLGLAIAILEEERYQEICERLKSAGFERDKNENGQPTNQRWRIESRGNHITVDFLIPATLPEDRGGKLRRLQSDFAAIIAPGLELAFLDSRWVTLSGQTIQGEDATREMRVCEAGAFVVLKALAFDGRGENKDAYDLLYILQSYGTGIDAIFDRLKPLVDSPYAKLALTILERDFTAIDAVGVRRFAEFLGDADNADVKADAAGLVRALLALCAEIRQ